MFILDGEPDPETGKMPTTKYNYYHINYRSIVNIVKEIVHLYYMTHFPKRELDLEGLHQTNFCRRSNDFCRLPIFLMKPSKSNSLLVNIFYFPHLIFSERSERLIFESEHSQNFFFILFLIRAIRCLEVNKSDITLKIKHRG